MLQSLLGPSAQNTLAFLIPYGPAPNATVTSATRNARPANGDSTTHPTFSVAFSLKPPISQLSDEILLPILHLVALVTPQHGPSCLCKIDYDRLAIKRLARVCRRFHRLLVPLAYSTLRVQISSKAVTSRLYRGFHDDSSVRQYCRALIITIDDQRLNLKKGDFAVAARAIPWMTNVRCVRISGDVQPRNRELIVSFVKMLGNFLRGVSHVELSRSGNGLWLSGIVAALRFPILKRLEINGVKELTGEGAQSMLKPEERDSSPITSLHLIDYSANPRATAQLLSWPTALSDFHIQTYYWNTFEADLPMFHSWLLPHKNSLRSLYISNMATAHTRQRHLFHACDFPVLEILHLSRWDMSEELASPTTDAEVMLGPRLREFKWDFTIFDQHSESWSDFGDKEENWLREFAKTAVARKAALARIKVQFHPDNWGCGESDHYPWDRMDMVRDEVEKGGVTIEYSEPSISREGWLRERRIVAGEEVSDMTDEEGESDEGSISSRQSDSESTWSGLDDPNPGKDIRQYFLPVRP